MGILNVTPDSFSDGGDFASPEAAHSRALKMLDEGADILDIGGESTKPNATALPSPEEQRRVLPIIDAVLKQRPEAVISIDTYHADTARMAVEAGVEIVNDVSGHLWDLDMSSTCAKLGCGAVLMHTRGRPNEWKTQAPLAHEQVVPIVLRELRQRTEHALEAGVERSRIVVDPGFGFGKIRQENYPLLARFSELNVLGYPLLAGLSRKSFLSSEPSGELKTEFQSRIRPSPTSATLVANTAAILAGAHIVRVHDVAEARSAADFADALLRAGADG